MPNFSVASICLCAFIASVAAAQPVSTSQAVRVASPDGQIVISLIGADAASSDLRYAVDFHGRQLFAPSKLGLALEGQAPLGPGMHLTGSKTATVDESYTIPVGKTSSVRDHYKGVEAEFEDARGRKLTIEARAFDDGVAFRYKLPAQTAIHRARIARELTEFTYVKDAATYPLIVDGFESAYEDDYQLRMVSGLHSDWLVALPYLANEPGTGWVAITEANISNYAGMYLSHDKPFSRTVHTVLAPHRDADGTLDPKGIAVETTAPFSSPWRVMMIADQPAKLIESNIILNLNPPSKIADTSWIKAGKTAWDWWSGDEATDVSFTPGMNTATMKHYIDFASASGFPYMLIDAGWAMPDPNLPPKGPHQGNITRAQPNIDMPELVRYAKEKNVKLWLWAYWTSVDKYMDQAFPLFEKWGIAGVKIDFMNRDDQWMVGWYQRVVTAAAEHHLMIDYHGAFKPDGLRRTWPNLMTRESVMGLEYLRVTARPTPAHNTTLPFTRMLAGPMDYTLGSFDNRTLDTFVARTKKPMSLGTRAQQLALFVVFESPFECVSDYPEHYKGERDFDFIKRVPTTWDEVHAIGGMPMQWIALARRSGRDWYMGSLTDWDARDIKVPLDFPGDGKYEAEIYADAPDAAENPTHTAISRQQVDRNSVLDVHMAPGGGNAMWIHPAE
jgi:alpha-glucosidase